MTGKLQRTAAAAEVSTGGSLITGAKLKHLYATMLHCRLLTEHAAGPRKRDRSASIFAASMGQEAITTGWVVDLRPEDTVALAFNDSMPSLVKGVPLGDMVAQLYVPTVSREPMHNIIPPAPSPEEQFSLILDVALANKRKKQHNVVVAFTSAATTTLACWQEALGRAAKRNLPVVFVVENNPWFEPSFARNGAGPLPEKANFLEKEDFMQHARSHGLAGITVDANDAVAVYRVAYESLDRVRQGGGPVLVEGKTYRTAGQAAPGQTKPGPGGHTVRDPLIHMERYLAAKKLFTARWKGQLVDEFSRELDAARKAARKAQKLASV